MRGPAWLRDPRSSESDANALVPQLWSGTARKVDGVLHVGGVALTDLVAEHGSPAYVLDERDFRDRAREFRDAFHDFDVFYAGKAFLCSEVARWVERRRYRSIRLVTNDLHMIRARYEVRRRLGQDIEVVADAVPTRPGFRQIFVEYNKFLLGRAADLIGI